MSGWRIHFPLRSTTAVRRFHTPRDAGAIPAGAIPFRVASIAVMQRTLNPQSTGQHRGDPPL